MGRVKNIPSGDGSQFPSQMILDTGGAVKAVYIQNPTGVDIFWSTEKKQLDKTDSAGLPTSGNLQPAAAPPNVPVTSLPRFKGRLFARAVAPGAELEVTESDIC